MIRASTRDDLVHAVMWQYMGRVRLYCTTIEHAWRVERDPKFLTDPLLVLGAPDDALATCMQCAVLVVKVAAVIGQAS